MKDGNGPNHSYAQGLLAWKQRSSSRKPLVAKLGVAIVCPQPGTSLLFCGTPEIGKTNEHHHLVIFSATQGTKNTVKLSVLTIPSTYHVSHIVRPYSPRACLMRQ